MSQNILIEDADGPARVALEKALKKEGLGTITVLAPGHRRAGLVIRLLESDREGNEPSPHDFTKPVRAGAVLQKAKQLLSRQGRGAEIVSFGKHKLNALNHELSHANGTVIRLTEKESHILCLLAAKPGDTVSRKALLENVWQYADGVETHTLETHIYRLRQKIEADPANPSLLLTDGAGYKLAKYQE